MATQNTGQAWRTARGFEPRPTDVFIVVVGATGAGKSTFISNLTDEDVEIGHGMDACTQEISVYSCDYNESTTVYLADTPGFDDTSRADTEVLHTLAEWLTDSYAKQIKLNGIIYLHRITDPRMQGASKRTLSMFRKLCGEDALKNIVLATTMWELVDPVVGERRENALIDNPSFWGQMIQNGSQTVRFQNSRESALRIVEIFVSRTTAKQKVVLSVQKEMVEDGKALDETAAGIELDKELAKERARFMKELSDIKADMDETLKQRDQEATTMLEEEKQAMEKKLKRLDSERESLNVSLEQLHKVKIVEMQSLQDRLEAARIKSRRGQAAFEEKAREQESKSRAALVAAEERLREIDVTHMKEVDEREAQMRREREERYAEAGRRQRVSKEYSQFEFAAKTYNKFGSLATESKAVSVPEYNRTEDYQQFRLATAGSKAVSAPTAPRYSRTERFLSGEDRDDLLEHIILALYDHLHLLETEGSGAVRRLKSALPELLLHFSMMIGNRDDNTMEGRTAALLNEGNNLIRPYQWYYRWSFRWRLLPSSLKTGRPKFEMNTDILSGNDWAQAPIFNPYIKDEHGANLLGVDRAEDDVELPEFVRFFPHALVALRQALLNCSGFHWLLRTAWSIRRISLSSTTRDSVIRRQALTILNDSSAFRRGLNVSIEVRIPWPFETFEFNQFEDSSSVDLGTVLILCGDENDAQVCTCAEYADHVWPGVGVEVINAVGSVFAMPTDHCSIALSGGTNIDFAHEPSGIACRVSGDRTTIIQVVEILAWLGSACRVSEEPDRIGLCQPTVRKDQRGLSIGYEWLQLTFSTATKQPQWCWHLLFRNQAVAANYPILVRDNVSNAYGLEASLDVMTLLGQTDWMEQVDGHTILTGCRTIFYPRSVTTSSVTWHFAVIDDPAADPHSALPSPFYCEVLETGADLTFLRHFVGWTGQARVIAGTSECNYAEVSASKSSRVGKGFALDSVTISVAQYAGGSVNLSRGLGATAAFTQDENANYNHYLLRFRSYKIVLYDSSELGQTAWLIDGASALLHIVQLFLAKQGNGFITNANAKVTEVTPNPDKRLTSSEATLLHDGNRVEPLWQLDEQTRGNNRGAKGWWYLQDQIVTFLKILGSIKYYYVARRTNPAVELDLNLIKDKIEGFDLIQLAEMEEPLLPRYCKIGLQRWVHLCKEADTIVLLCSGLGSLIQPSEKCCEAKKLPPTGHNLLVAHMPVLSKIALDLGQPIYESRTVASPGSGHVNLAPGMNWKDPAKAIAPCRCPDGSQSLKCRPQPIELDRLSPRGSRPCSISPELALGAVLLGKEKKRSKSPSSSQASSGRSSQSQTRTLAKRMKDFIRGTSNQPTAEEDEDLGLQEKDLAATG